MTDGLPVLDQRFASVFTLSKNAVVIHSDDQEASTITQFGAATITSSDRPEWPTDLVTADTVIETYVASSTGEIEPMSDNEPYVSAWRPLVSWFVHTVQAALSAQGISPQGDAYVTASLTRSATLEGLAHMDDDVFIPTDGVGVVAIIGEHAGPRVATKPLSHHPLRPMSQVQFSDEVIEGFGSDPAAICCSLANQIVVFPQFAQLHAGPAAVDIDPALAFRQLLVYRGPTTPTS